MAIPSDSVAAPPGAAIEEPQRKPAPAEAYAEELMPLGSTGVTGFLRRHPTYDGRGVLIAILDGGIDPGIPGLRTTSTGDRKVLELRDFSGEGKIPLEAVVPRGDSVQVVGHWLRGFGRVRALNSHGPYYAGALSELALGKPPASDVNGNGASTDTLPILVTRASDGWVLMTDIEGDASLSNDRPVHDFAVAKEYFGWHAPGRVAPLDFAVNFADSAGTPRLDLLFDGYSHGSHVAGIAAGNDLYGIKGFDGVAPGAQIIGLKIGRDVYGGISSTGAIIKALDYAIRFASARRLPLVVNLSFGLGNAPGVVARIDEMVDSVLAEHPDVVMCVSAGNDGPGHGSLSSPGSATRVITVGATLAGGFRPPDDVNVDPLMYFSARGGSMAKPDIVAPGAAYSTVPRYNAGIEIEQGTSMASPHAAGLAALLLSGLNQTKRTATARQIRQALMVTARPASQLGFLDEGTGLPDVGAAFRWLETERPLPEVQVRALDQGTTAAYRPAGLRGPGDTTQVFQLIRPRGDTGTITFRLKNGAPWLVAPSAVQVNQTLATVTLQYRPDLLKAPGIYSAVVSGWTTDTLAGPAFRLVNTVVVPYPPEARIGPISRRLSLGEDARLSFSTETDRPFDLVVRTTPAQQALGFLHEPGGQPALGADQITAGGEAPSATLAVDAEDVRPGVYEAVAVNWGAQAGNVSLQVTTSPVAIRTTRTRAGVVVAFTNRSGSPVSVSSNLVLVGGERHVKVVARGSEPERIPITVPEWAVSGEFGFEMEPAIWARLTDMGMSLRDSIGRPLVNDPASFPRSQLRADLAESAGSERPVTLDLLPAFAEPERSGGERWVADISIRFSASADRVITIPGKAAIIAPGATEEQTLALPDRILPLGPGFFPLAVVTAAVGDRVWTRTVGLPEPKPPLAR
ncbi:MAG TPA: S8 family serine peptidase [Gemmatimonadales bacterium]|nr:S8 family serine peptidase [Gemmatimonadales bacterium]